MDATKKITFQIAQVIKLKIIKIKAEVDFFHN